MNDLNRHSSSTAWRVCCALALFLAALAMSPLVIPEGRAEPMLSGMPLTLWAGMGVALGLVLLTAVGQRVHPDRDWDEELEDRDEE